MVFVKDLVVPVDNLFIFIHVIFLSAHYIVELSIVTGHLLGDTHAIIFVISLTAELSSFDRSRFFFCVNQGSIYFHVIVFPIFKK